LFLDEIGDMPPLMQSKILRVLQEREVERVGGVAKHHVDVRIVAATNRRLEDMVQEGDFREDLYYRLNIIRLLLPPLRSRKDDIPLLLTHHLQKICKRFGLENKSFSKEAMLTLINYTWPGNVRELVNTVEMLVSLSESDTIQPEDLPERFGRTLIAAPNVSAALPALEQENNILTKVKNSVLEREKELILKILAETNGNKAAAARKLGIQRSTLYEKLKKHNITTQSSD